MYVQNLCEWLFKYALQFINKACTNVLFNLQTGAEQIDKMINDIVKVLGICHRQLCIDVFLQCRLGVGALVIPRTPLVILTC